MRTQLMPPPLLLLLLLLLLLMLMLMLEWLQELKKAAVEVHRSEDPARCNSYPCATCTAALQCLAMQFYK